MSADREWQRSPDQKAVRGFEEAYRRGADRLSRSRFRAYAARELGSAAIEDAYQQAALEHWTYFLAGNVKPEIFDGSRFDVEKQVAHLLGRTRLRLIDELEAPRESVVVLETEKEDLAVLAQAPASQLVEARERISEAAKAAATASPYGAEVLLMKHLLGAPHARRSPRVSG